MAEKRMQTSDIVIIALMTSLIAVCSFIAIPFGAVPVTFQTFAVFASVGIAGRKRGMISVFVYILLGLVGIPVFSGFQSGLSVLTGPTGGYISGFLPAVFVSGLIIKKTGRKIPFMILAFFAGLVICYICGLLWYVFVFAGNNVDFCYAFSLCVFPYIIPDAVKVVFAAVISKSVGERLKNEYNRYSS